MRMWVDISFAEVVDVGGLVMRLSYVRKKGSSANMPLLPKAFPSSPTLGAKVLYSEIGFHSFQVHWVNTSHLCWAWLAGF